MTKRIMSLFLAVLTLVSTFTLPASAAPTLEEAMAEVDVYARNDDLEWLTMNGSVKTQHYTYYNFTSTQTGQTKEIPAYCVDPRLYGVPALVDEGTAIKYSAESIVNDPKVCGIIANGYPHMPLSTLGVNSVEEAYYATKTALWIYLLGNWSLDGLGINPKLSGPEKTAAERVLKATRDIYNRGMTWDKMVSPKLTATADQDTAYPVTINGESYYQQVITINSETWPIETVKLNLANGAPDGAKILDMDNKEIDRLTVNTSGTSGYEAQCKIVYPASEVEGQTGTAQLNMNSVVVQYAIYYARCLEMDEYGNVQDYMLDTDPHIPITASFISRFSAEPDNPGTPDEPDTPGTNLRIIKLEEGTDKPLKGAVFEVIYPNGDVVGSFATNAKGIIEIPVTITGNYTVTELIPPEDHLLPERTTQNVTVVHGKTAEVTFWNAPYGNLRVEKISDTGEPLEGVTIQIKHIESGETQTGKTSGAGVITFGGLKPGGYEVRELAGIKGWQADTDTIQTVSIVTGETSTVTFTNKELPGLRILKYDRTTLKVMSDVTFEIWQDGVSLGQFNTDQMGEILLLDAQPGTYLVKEVQSDDEHIVDTTPQQIELKAGDGIKDLVFFNNLKPGLRLVKVDSANPSKVIPNAVFEIKSVDGSYGPEEFTTDKNGEIDLSKLPTGAYVVTEKSCPGYVIDQAQRIIQLNANETAEFVFTNSKRPSFTLVKLDSYDSTPLGGVTFRLAKIEDGTHYIDRVTDTNGQIHVDDLDPSIYSVTEIDVPEGYIKNKGEWHVELFPGKDSELVVTNDRKSDLTIRKTDKDTGEAIPGVTFTLSKVDGATITTEPTGKDGTVTISRLEPGVYTVTEQNVPEGYILDTVPQMVTVFPNRNTSVHFQNHKRPTLTISKVDINGNALPGAIFEVKTKDGVKIGDYPVDKNGKVTISNVHLDEGYHIMTEIQAPEGYILDKTPHEVYLRPGKTTEITIENEEKPDLTIRKIDSVVGDGLKGAKFEILVGKDGNQNGTYQQLDKSYYYTDENGLIQLDDLDTGWYKIKEIEPPDGFMLKEPSEQTIYVEHDKAVEVTFENIPKSALVIRKIDSDTGAPLANAWFRVRYLGGTSGSGGTIIGEYNTSANGNIIVTNLDAGTYIIEEINAPDGYVIDTAPQTAYISGKEQDCITLSFTNSKNGALLIKKVDSVSGAPLSDVEFFVTTSDGTVVGNANGKFVTDSAGTILISNIAPGTTLVVKETKTRDGYVLDEMPQTIKVQSNATMTMEFRNQPKGNLIINKLDSVTKKPLKGVEFKITYADGSFVDAEGGKLSTKGVYVTDSNGQIKLSGVYGTLVVTEEKTIEGYSIAPETRSQSVVVNAGDTQTITVYNDPHGSLLITKVDSVTKEPLSGVEFKIAGCNGCEYPAGTYTTDSNGTIQLKSIPSGYYSITETRAKDGYLLNDTVHTVKVESGTCKEVTFENSPLGGLVIKKMDAVTKEPLAGAIFRVTTADGAAVGNSGGEYRTDERGYISIPDVKPSSLIVTEIKAPDGYLLDDTSKTIEIKNYQTYVLEFFNQPKGNLIINKLDSITGEPLKGVEFKITYADGSYVDAEGGKLSSKGIYITDSNGQIKLSGVYGTLVVTEEKTIDGYSIDPATRSQSVVVNAGDTQTLTFYNDPYGSLLITKVDSVTKEPLSGVEFKIAGCNGCEYPAGTYTTDSNGTIRLKSVPSGCYTITETKAKAGYLLDNTVHTVKVESASCKEVTFGNTPLGGLVIKKMDAVTKEPLAGAVFRVTTADGAAVGNSGGEYRTDERGYISIPDVKPSSLIVTEIKAPKGYLLDDTSKTVEIKDHQTYVLEFFNQPLGSLIIHKLDSVTKVPLEGVQFKITYADGKVVEADGGQLSSNGLYWTDENGQIKINGITGTVVVTEMETIEGYTIHEEARSQTVVINTNDTQSLYFYNDPVGGVEIIKVNADKRTERIPSVTFEIRKVNDELVDTVTTDKNGRVYCALEDGAYYAVEIKAADGFKLDNTPHYFEVVDGKTSTLTIENKPLSGILIHKVDADTGDGIYGATFLLYDRNKNPIGQYTTDQDGYIHIDDGLEAGRYYLREIKAADGYILDNTLKTVYIRSGSTTEIEWENRAIRGQIQIIKKSANDNPINGLPAGTRLEGAVFEIYNKAGNKVDTIRTDYNGRAVSRLLPLSRYTIREVQAPAYYAVNPTVMTAYLEYEGQIVTFEVENDSVSTGVAIKKSGYAEVMPGQPIKYTLTGIGNSSTVPLGSFYWRDNLPGQVKLDKIVTGTYNQQLSYKVVYKTNLSDQYRTLADNLSTTKNYVLDARPVVLGLAANEKVTEIMFVFGTVKAGFGQVETPYIYGTVANGLSNGSSIVNVADVGGLYQNQWIQAVSRWVTNVYAKTNVTLPKTGY